MKIFGKNFRVTHCRSQEEAGQPPLGDSFCPDSENIHIPFSEKPPDKTITHRLDVRPIIEAGDHPKEQVLTLANELKVGDCMEFISSFPPTPLIDLLQKKGYAAIMTAPEKGGYEIGRQIDKIILNRRNEPFSISIDPLHIELRKSTEQFSIKDKKQIINFF